MRRMTRVFLTVAALLLGGLTAVVPASPAQALDCVDLGADALVFGSPRVSGQVLAMSTLCYALPMGTSNALYLKSWSDYTPARIVDAGDQVMCTASIHNETICHLTGSEPYRLEVVNENDYPAPFDFSVFSLGTCPDAQISQLGQPTTFFTGSIPAGAAKCRDLTLAAGTYLIAGTYTGNDGLVDITTGQAFCPAGEDVDHVCTVPGGSYSLLVRGSTYDPATYSLAIVDLEDVSACASVASTTWASAPMAVSPSSGGQWDCHVLTADPGDRMIISGDSGLYDHPVHLLVLDSDGQVTCARIPTVLGCVVTGTGPYRILTGDDADYQVVARSLATDTDCPVITPRAFGEPAADNHPGVGCRRFEGVAGHHYLLAPLTAKGKALGGLVYGPDFTEIGSPCDGGFPWCTPAQTGTQWVVTSPFARSSVTAFADLASTSGCRAQALNLTPRTTSLAPGEFDCATLDIPGGGNLGIVRDIRTLNEKPVVTIVDSAGDYVCSTYGGNETSLLRCPLTTGVAPYRAIVGLGPARAATSTAYLRLDRPRGCGKLSNGKGVTVKLSSTTYARCYVARKDRKRWEPLSVARKSGKAVVELGAATTSGGICSSYVRAASMTARCLMVPVSAPFTVVVTGNRKSGTFQLKRSR